MDVRGLLNQWTLKLKRYRNAHHDESVRNHRRNERIEHWVMWLSWTSGTLALLSATITGWPQKGVSVCAGVVGLGVAALSSRAKQCRERADGHQQVSVGYDSLSRRADRALASEAGEGLEKAMDDVEHRFDELRAQATNLPLPDDSAEADRETDRETLRPPARRTVSKSQILPKRTRASLPRSENPPAQVEDDELEPDHRENKRLGS